MKRCSMCKKEKPESAFFRQGGTKSNANALRAHCKFCHSYRQSISPTVSASRMRYREANRERMRAYHREYMKQRREEAKGAV